jgi:hypothetical protein
MLGGLVALYVLFGLPAMWLGVVAIYLLYLWLARRAPVYFEDAPFMLGSDKPTLPPPGKQALPPQGWTADRPVEPSAHEASTGVAEKEPLKRQETVSKSWRVTPAMIAACDAARDTALRKQGCRPGAGRARDRGAPSMGAPYPSIPCVAVACR